jgi:alpha-ketoglutarate-dependent 2,4-dichlorophenoxyacetate dioxygenase
MTFTVNPIGPRIGDGAFGAELRGASLHRPPSPELISALNDAMARYAVVVLRDQMIDDEEQIRFARAFGPLELPPHMGLPGIKSRIGFGLYDISNLDDNGNFLPIESLRLASNKANEEFHTDSSFNDLPTKWSMLSARLIPPQEGDTEFCDARAAYDALPRSIQARAAEAVAEHWFWKTRAATYKVITEDMRRAMPPARHPVVRTVGGSGRKTLYLGAHATHIVDWPRDDSEHFIAELNAHIQKPAFRYRHRWKLGDLVVWDNRCTLHRATQFDVFKYKRDMRRATINEFGPEISSTAALGVPAPKM